MVFSELTSWTTSRMSCDGVMVAARLHQHPCIRTWFFSTMDLKPGQAWRDLSAWCDQRGIASQDMCDDAVWVETAVADRDLWEDPGMIDPGVDALPDRYVTMGRWFDGERPRGDRYQLLVGFSRVESYLLWINRP